MRANLVLDVELRSPYGPSFCLGPGAPSFIRKYGEPVKKHQALINYIVGSLAKSNVNYLEKLATSLYVSLEHPSWETGELAREITELKPHIPIGAAIDALEEMEKLKGNAQKLGLEVL
jgi:hypothetical protein